MTPLQKVAMGLVIVLLDASFNGWDGVPDPVGWALAAYGLVPLGDRVLGSRTVLAAAVVALVVSVGTYPPAVNQHLDASVGWLLSLPQVVVLALLCRTLQPYAEELAGRLRVLFWVFVAVGALPPVALGGGVEVLVVPAAAVAVFSALYLVYLLFRLAGRPFATAAAPSPER